MAERGEVDESLVLERFRQLSSERKRMVLDFLEFLASQEYMATGVAFDAWALNLAKEQGFAHLTEEDIVRIVDEARGQSSCESSLIPTC